MSITLFRRYSMDKQLAKEFLAARKADGDYELKLDGIDLTLGGGKARYIFTKFVSGGYFAYPVLGEERILGTFGYKLYSKTQIPLAIRRFEAELEEMGNTSMTDREFVIERRANSGNELMLAKDGYTLGDTEGCYWSIHKHLGDTRFFITPFTGAEGDQPEIDPFGSKIYQVENVLSAILDWEAKVMGETPSVGGGAVEDVKPKPAAPITYAEFVRRRGGAELVKGEDSRGRTTYGDVEGYHYRILTDNNDLSYIYLEYSFSMVPVGDDPFPDSCPDDEILNRIKAAEGVVTNLFDVGKTVEKVAELCRVANEAMNASGTVKPMLSRLPYVALEQIALVLQHGDSKYPKDGWKGSFPWSRSIDKAMRHLHKWNSGEDKDPESGLSHLAHAAANLMFLLHYETNGTGKDDR